MTKLNNLGGIGKKTLSNIPTVKQSVSSKTDLIGNNLGENTFKVEGVLSQEAKDSINNVKNRLKNKVSTPSFGGTSGSNISPTFGRKIAEGVKASFEFGKQTKNQIAETYNNFMQTKTGKVAGAVGRVTMGTPKRFMGTSLAVIALANTIGSSIGTDINDIAYQSSMVNTVAEQTVSNALGGETSNMKSLASDENLLNKNLGIVDKYSNKFVLQDYGDGKYLLKTPLVNLRSDSFVSALAETKGIDKKNIIPMFDTEQNVYKLSAIESYTGSKERMKEFFEILSLEGEKLDYDAELNAVLSYEISETNLSQYKDEALYLQSNGNFQINKK